MVRVTLVRFRSYLEVRTFDFPNFQITLLDGPSGSGKSTILEAIRWALYGSIQHIYPSGSTGSASQQTCVLVEVPELNGIWIRRTKPPEIVELGLPEPGFQSRILTGPSAQSQIDAIFGTKQLWSAVSYVVQQSQSPLLTLSSTEKFQLLELLTFGSKTHIDVETPEYYLNKLSVTADSIKQYLATENSRYNANFELHSRILKTQDSALQLWQGADTKLPDLESKLAGLDRDLETLKSAYLSSRDLEVRIAEFNANLGSHQSRLEIVRAFCIQQWDLATPEDLKLQLHRRELELNEAKQQLRDWNRNLEVKARIRDLELRESKLAVIPEHLDLTPEARAKIVSELERDRSRHLSFERLDIKPTSEGLKSALEDTARNLQIQDAHCRWQDEVKARKLNHQAQMATHLAMIETARSSYEQSLLAYKLVVQQNQQIREQYQRAVQNYDQSRANYQSYQHRVATAQTMQSTLEDLKSGLTKGEDEVKDQIQKLTSYLKELVCPHCQMGVTLKVEDTWRLDPGVTDTKTRARYESELKELRSQQELQTRVQNLQYQYLAYIAATQVIAEPGPEPAAPVYHPEPAIPTKPEVLEPPVFDVAALPEPPKPSPKLLTLQHQLRDLELPTQSRSEIDRISASLHSVPELLQIRAELKSLGRLISEDLSTPPKDAAQIQRWSQDLDQMRTKTVELETAMASLTALKSQQPPLPPTGSAEIQSSILDLQKVINSTRDLIGAGKIVADLEIQRQQLEEQHKQLLQYMAYEGHIFRLRDIVNEVATGALEEVVATINDTTNDILQHLFEEEIKISLRTHKELKTRDKVKRIINLQIVHRGLAFDNFNHLSGGEQVRLSLALTLAMASIFNSPLLCLDECMASLNAHLREKAIRVLQSRYRHKTIIHICHETVEGFHDHTIRL